MLVILIILSIILSFKGFYNTNTIEDVDLFILQMNILYIVLNMVYLFNYRRKGIFCPEFLLSIVFYFSCFILSIVSFSGISNNYIFPKNEMVRGMSLALIGWISFIIGAIIANKRDYSKVVIKNIKTDITAARLFLICCSCLIMTYFLFEDGQSYINRYRSDGKLTDSVFWLTLFMVLSSFYEFMNLHNKNTKTIKTLLININKLYLILVLIIVTFFLFTGNRSEVLQVLLPIIFLYHTYIQKIKPKYLFAFVILSIFLFTVIREGRSGDSVVNYSELIRIENLTKDFISANAALPVLINHTERQGSAMGYNAFLQILAIVPFLQGIVMNLFEFQSLESSSLINSIELRGVNFDSGQGTNVIGDLFYTMDIYGVLIGMFLLGYAFVFLFNRFNYRKLNIYQSIAFLVMFGNIIYLVRVEFFYILRLISFSLIVLLFVNSFFGVKYTRA